MATLESMDNVDGGAISQNFDGITATRVAILSAVDGNADEKQYNAITDNSIPNIGDAHPVVPNVTLSNKSAESIGKEQFRVTMIYTNPNTSGGAGAGSPSNVSMSTVLQDVEVTTYLQKGDGHEAGEVISVKYVDKANSIVAEDLDDQGPTTIRYEQVDRERWQTKTVIVKMPLITVTFQRRTTIPPLTEAIGPSQKGTTVGAINEDPFIFDRDPGFWLCTRIEGSSPDGGQTFDTTYEFIGAPPVFTTDGIVQTWDIPLFYIDEETGNIPRPLPPLESIKLESEGGATLATTNGIQIVRPYVRLDFGFLDLVDVGELV